MSRRQPVKFGLAASEQRKQAVQAFRRRCYTLMGRTDLVRQEGMGAVEQERLDQKLHLIEARVGTETIGTIRWGTYASVAGEDHYADSIIQNRTGLPSQHPADFSRTDRLVIHPEYRRGTVLIGLARFCLQLAIEAGSRFDLCWSEEHLARVYRRLGYEVLPQRLLNARADTLYPQILSVQQFRKRWSSRDQVTPAPANTLTADQNQLSTSC